MDAVGFLAPLMLVGAIAIGVPIAIHLIGRRRAKIVPFAALDFLMATKRKTARRLQLRERVLLLVRLLACLVVAIALAKPFTSCERKGPQVTRGPQAAVIVIDDSFASGYIVDGRPWIKRATDEARRILTQLGPEAEVAIVRASEAAEHPTELTRDHIRLRDQLLALDASARPPDTTRALVRAAQLLAASSHRRKTVFLLSLLANVGLHGNEADPPWGKDGPTLVTPDLRPAKLPNLAVTSLRVDPDPGTGSRGVAFYAEIGNFGDAPAKVELALTIADHVVARGQLDVGAHERKTKPFLAALPAGARSADADVQILSSATGPGGGVGDALPIDDRRYVRATLRDEVRVLLVDGDPRTVRHDDELFYLEAALRPGDRDDSGTRVRSITPEELAGLTSVKRELDLNDFDVVVLANVAALPADQVAALADWVRAGGGIFVAPGDRVDPTAYDRTMLPLLPQSLRDPIDTTWGASPEDRDSRALRLVKWEVDHPIFQPFSKDAPELADAKFFKVSLLGPTTATQDRKVLARFTNGAAALVEASIGAGRTLLFTSTLDRDWNDLPIHPGFLPFVQQAVRYLARKHATGTEGEHLIGASVALPTGDLKKLEVRGPDNIGAVFEGDRLEGRSSVRFGRTDHPGIYRVIGTDQTGATHPRDELAFAINLDPRGSDLTMAPPSALPVSGSGSGTAPDDSRRRVELWHGLAALVLLLLVAEGILVQR